MTKSARTWIPRVCGVTALLLLAALVALLAVAGWSAPAVPVVLLVGGLVLVGQLAAVAHGAVDYYMIGRMMDMALQVAREHERERAKRAREAARLASDVEIEDELLVRAVQVLERRHPREDVR
jgi:Skp family chaperone for outer membrane proteins